MGWPGPSWGRGEESDCLRHLCWGLRTASSSPDQPDNPSRSFPALLPPCHLCGFLPVQVMVWIHGGGLLVGGASTYDGLALSAHENVVVVTIQYRLGLWGFFR